MSVLSMSARLCTVVAALGIVVSGVGCEVKSGSKSSTGKTKSDPGKSKTGTGKTKSSGEVKTTRKIGTKPTKKTTESGSSINKKKLKRKK